MKPKKILFLFITFLMLIPGCAKTNAGTQPLVKEGILDLRNWDIDKDGPVTLNGEWEFYWEKLLTPEDFTRVEKPKKTGFITVPGIWTRYPVKGKELPPEGYASFRLTILTGNNKGALAIKLYGCHTAYEFLVNGKKIASNGTLGLSPELSVPEWRPLVADLSLEKDSMEILIRVSNYHHTNGGVTRPIILGTEKDIRNAREKELNTEFFLLGSIFIMCLYHLALYLLRRSDTSPFYFSINCLLVSFYVLFSNELYFTTLFPFIDWFMLYYLMGFLIRILLPFTIVMYLHSLFPEEFPRLFSRIVLAVCLFFQLLFFIIPRRDHDPLFTAHNIALAILGICILSLLILALIRKRKEAGSVYLGSIILFLAVGNDILYDAGIIQTWSVMAYGVFLFIFSQAYLLSRRFSKAFFAVEQLTASLEQKVEERTGELKNANEKLKEMDRAKTNLFTNISHELRTPLTLITSPIESIINGDYGNTLSKEESLFKSMHRNGLRLLKLINNLLDFSKIDAGRMLLSRETTDIVKLLEFLVSSIHSG
ncbi:MAG: hypothetical protein GY754_21995, partial [bacterium]|nr:hypothetical protein [bacterium]